MIFADKLLKWHFDKFCSDHFIVIMRGNIWKSVKIKDYEHLIELWRNHPRYQNHNESLHKLHFELRKFLRDWRKGFNPTWLYMFSFGVDVTPRKLGEIVLYKEF